VPAGAIRRELSNWIVWLLPQWNPRRQMMASQGRGGRD
jgi:hypothetical protein